jgi:hypothetical protein
MGNNHKAVKGSKQYALQVANPLLAAQGLAAQQFAARRLYLVFLVTID